MLIQRSNDEIVQQLGSRIKAIRLSRNLTQAQLAKRSGVATRTVANIEGGAGISLRNLVDLMIALGRTGDFDDFLYIAPFSPVEIAKLKGQKRRRASSPRKPNKEKEKD